MRRRQGLTLGRGLGAGGPRPRCTSARCARGMPRQLQLGQVGGGEGCAGMPVRSPRNRCTASPAAGSASRVDGGWFCTQGNALPSQSTLRIPLRLGCRRSSVKARLDLDLPSREGGRRGPRRRTRSLQTRPARLPSCGLACCAKGFLPGQINDAPVASLEPTDRIDGEEEVSRRLAVLFLHLPHVDACRHSGDELALEAALAPRVREQPRRQPALVEVARGV